MADERGHVGEGLVQLGAQVERAPVLIVFEDDRIVWGVADSVCRLGFPAYRVGP